MNFFLQKFCLGVVNLKIKKSETRKDEKQILHQKKLNLKKSSQIKRFASILQQIPYTL